MAKIIGISGISGAGTTTITEALGAKLNVTTVHWDDFDNISQSPQDYLEWFHQSKNYDDWHYPALENVLHELKRGHEVIHPALERILLPTPIVIFDGSLGRLHKATGRYIDLAIHLDTSMDVALARRLIRGFGETVTAASGHDIIDELSWYLNAGRVLFDATEIKNAADVVVDGNLSVNEIVAHIMASCRDFLKG